VRGKSLSFVRPHMGNARRVLGLVLLATSFLDVGIALFMLSPEERPLVLLPGLVGIVAGFMTFRGVRYWTLFAAVASLAYLSYGADITVKKVLNGEWGAVASSFSLPLQDPSISILAKITFVWFQAVLPLLLVAVLAFCMLAWVRAMQTGSTRGAW
jgi:hypothetical protein